VFLGAFVLLVYVIMIDIMHDHKALA
jgi:hypothetical protein